MIECSRFSNSVYVAGCQRSGTTALTKLIASAPGFQNFQLGTDAELDAALILSGVLIYESSGRHCFQTTYLNESYHEYAELPADSRMIWLIRNPRSVVCSMLYNWERFALDELFEFHGINEMRSSTNARIKKHFGLWNVSALSRACYSYNAKSEQLESIINLLGPDRVFVADYDELVQSQNIFLPKIFKHCDIPVAVSSEFLLHSESLSKSNKLHRKQSGIIDEICGSYYNKARSFLSY